MQTVATLVQRTQMFYPRKCFKVSNCLQWWKLQLTSAHSTSFFYMTFCWVNSLRRAPFQIFWSPLNFYWWHFYKRYVSCESKSLPSVVMAWLTDMINWFIDWLTVWLIDWLNDWLTDWLTDRLMEGLTDWLTDWLINRLIDWLIDGLIDWLWQTTPQIWVRMQSVQVHKVHVQ